jgi:hypothetical protein
MNFHAEAKRRFNAERSGEREGHEIGPTFQSIALRISCSVPEEGTECRMQINKGTVIAVKPRMESIYHHI